MSPIENKRRLGASVTPSGVEFRVWAPGHSQVEVEFTHQPPCLMHEEADGVWSVTVDQARSGDLYRFRIGGWGYPDPYSRCQPAGPHGPSMVIDPESYTWRDATWRGVNAGNQIVYELHIGTFTEEGTYSAAAAQLPRLQQLGVTCLELMPVNEFVGDFGWGYDGVNWFAPYHRYGSPDDLKAFVDAAHECGLGVILDVVYNHFGHDGNYLPRFAPEYLTDTIENPWGAAPNYACHAMRRLAIDNATYWIREFHFDGLRLDAIQNIFDPSAPALLGSLVQECRVAASPRTIAITAEDYLQRTHLLHDCRAGGADLDHLWNDDFHHACRVALTGNHTGFFANHRGTAQEILSTLKRGFLFQGQFDGSGKMPRGEPVRDEPLSSFVAFLQNHDAVANTLHGQRLQAIVSPGKYRALTAALLLGPHTPLLFMGQEFGARTPFAYFADYPADAGTLWQGRRQEAAHFLQYQDPMAQARIFNPCSPDAVKSSVLQHLETDTEEETRRLHADLIVLRKRFAKVVSPGDVDGATLTESALVLRWFEKDGADRLLVINLGRQIDLRSRAEPLLAPPVGRRWQTLWSSESPLYGGMGSIDVCAGNGWQMGAESAALLISDSADPTAVPVPRSVNTA